MSKLLDILESLVAFLSLNLLHTNSQTEKTGKLYPHEQQLLTLTSKIRTERGGLTVESGVFVTAVAHR